MKILFIFQLFVVFIFLYLIYCFCSSSSTDCSLFGSKKRFDTYLAVVIITNPANERRREIIRETWLTLNRKVFYSFVVGTSNLGDRDVRDKLRLENEKFGDLLIFDDHEDSYRHLTAKVLKSFIWYSKNVRFSFLLKLDDDSFVRLDALQQALKSIDEPNKDRLYWGFMDGRAPVRFKGKWAEPDWILCDRYLPHALGGGYVLSSKLISFIADNADLLKLYNSEDVAVGTWLSGLDVFYLHDSRFDTEWKSRGCFNDYLVTHKQTDDDMKTKFQSLKTSGKLCPEEIRLRNSYLYNWNVPASQCCKRDNGTLS